MSENQKEFFNDYNKLISDIGSIQRSGKNPRFTSKYVTLESILEAVRPALAQSNFVLIQYTMGLVLCTELRHVSGEKITSTIPLVSKDMEDPQKIGAALTYFKRYSIIAILLIAETDDDGNHAAEPKKPEPKKPEPSKQKYPDPVVPSGQKDGLCPDDVPCDEEPVPWKPPIDEVVESVPSTATQWAAIKSSREKAFITSDAALKHIMDKYKAKTYKDLSQMQALEVIDYFDGESSTIAEKDKPLKPSDTNPL